MHVMERGMYYAYAAMVLWALLDVTIRFALVTLGSNPVVLTCYSIIVGGLVLMLMGWRGRVKLATFMNVWTWVYGVLRMLLSITFTAAFLYITATEGGFLLRASFVLIMVVYFFVLRRSFTKPDLIGSLIFLTGFLWMASRLEDGFMNLGLWLVGVAIILDVLLNMVLEFHPIGKRVKGFSEHSQYTGVVLCVSGLFFLLLAFIASQFYLPTEADTALMKIVNALAASPADFSHMPTIIVSIIMGFTLRAPIMYLYFKAINMIKADNVLMVSAIGPFAALGFESIFSALGLMDMSTFDGWDAMAGLLMTAGAIFAAFVRLAKRQEKDRPKEWFEKELDEIEQLEAERMKQGDPVTKVN
jgi:hypothetical protein